MDIAIGIIVIILLLSPFALIIYFAITFQRKMFRKAWQNMQDIFSRHNIRLLSQIPEKKSVMLSLHGESADGRFEVFNKVIGTGKSRQTITQVNMRCSRSLPDFTVSKENIFTKIGETFGAKDAKTGDPEFDKIFRLHMNESGKDKLFNNENIAFFLSIRKDLQGQIKCSANVIEVVYYGVPGTKTGIRQFNAVFDAAMKLIQTKFPSAAHSPRV